MEQNSNPGPQTRDLVDRAKSIILKPTEEWPKIAEEPTGISDVFVKYAVPLAAIGPVCTLIGSQLFGYGAFGFTYRPSFMGALGAAVASYVATLVGLFILMLIANFLAPKFGGTQDGPKAFKLVAYSMTAGWIAAVFGLLPALGIIAAIGGLYGIYLFYLGGPVMMKVPQEKAVGYTAVTILAAIVLYLVVGAVTSAAAHLFGHSPYDEIAESGEMSGTMNIPGVGSVDVGKAQKAAERAEKMAKGELKPISTDQLKALLPASIGSYSRTGFDSMAAGGLSHASATYEDGGNRFDLRISDTNALGALGGMGVAMGMEQSSENADGYERTGVVDGRMQSEKWSKSGSRGHFGVMVADRFMVEADGSVPNIDVLKQAVATIDEPALEKLSS
ncbi:hypothetical protein MB02_13310 [Croceicoccus estronivorus]|uniref:Yip1 family protein n=1 Tax=Croceicoccus estronivorus TaxID=1172626 RepID=UPI00082E9639|nr:Yip1 family protein [Croceicoccus estronivorus]OCC23231.1 hypothetical protein MB02_13310 [Croceicoccus estronivorus]